MDGTSVFHRFIAFLILSRSNMGTGTSMQTDFSRQHYLVGIGQKENYGMYRNPYSQMPMDPLDWLLLMSGKC
jgi:hypothetical protein